MALLEPSPVTLKTLSGAQKTYVLSKFPAIAGREIFAGYPTTALPKFAEYKANEAIMMKAMCFVAVEMPNGNTLALTTQDLINNHVPDWETLAKLEIALMQYNSSFLDFANLSSFSKNFMSKALLSISPTLTRLLGQLSEAVKRHSKN